MSHHHPSEEMLLSYAAGSMSEPLALLVATHLALCPQCRHEVAAYEMLAGEELEDQSPALLSSDSLVRVLDRLDAPEAAAEAPQPPLAAQGDLRLPRPLRDYVAGSLDSLDWHQRGGIAEASLLPERDDFKTRLMRIRPKTAIPEHSHHGSEYTLVLTGGFSDHTGHFVRGDVAIADPAVQHRPIADAGEDCICLAVTDAPLRFTGPIARLLSPLLQR
ncbi:MAG: ChrR family anti-sigma-E factor [Kiloniellales bacterium]|nr:ChrR family anti-sigma-E factor [Kiloniellales bacterium]